MVSISCTERITRDRQIAWTRESARKAGHDLRLIAEPAPTFDHPAMPELPERNYFRALVWRVD
jgi:23S rRNA G2069 N7-methylase RlmK/C1962 C5-methylase RlmI